jgi:hypothetical protein
MSDCYNNGTVAVRWLGAVTVILASLLGVGLFFLAKQAPPPPAVIPPGEQMGNAGPDTASFGWVDDQQEVLATAATLEFPRFADTPAGKTKDDLPTHAYLWEAYVALYAKVPPPQNQNPVGSCVSFGTSRAMERSLSWAIVHEQAPFKFEQFREEVIYAVSRVDVGGGRIGGDGSVGAWAAKGATEYGHLPAGTYGSYDLTKYDPTRCRQWGSRGVPSDLKPELAKFKTGSPSQVKTWAEAKKSLAQGYGIAVCSNQGFSRQRDANGICRPEGSWAHCMCLDGYHTEGGKEYGHIENSWGTTYHTGPVGWGSPSEAGFWAESSVIERMLKANDSWNFSTVRGFPRRRVDWVQNVVPVHPHNIARRFNIALAW